MYLDFYLYSRWLLRVLCLVSSDAFFCQIWIIFLCEFFSFVILVDEHISDNVGELIAWYDRLFN